MTDPLQLLFNDMSRLIMQSQNIFEVWKDSNAETLNNGCINPLKQSFNSYANEINTRMQIYMRAQKQVEESLYELSKLNK
jgi:hypothetical protein